MLFNLTLSLFRYETWGKIFTISLILILIFYIYISRPILNKNFEQNHPGKWNMLLVFVCLYILIILLGLALFNAEIYDPLLPYPFSYYLAVFWLGWIVICFLTNKTLRKWEEFRHNNENRTITESSSPPKYNIEVQRKIVHFFAVVLLATFPIAPYLFNVVYIYVYFPFSDFYGGESGEIMTNLLVMGDLSNIQNAIYAGLPCLFLVLFATLFVEFDGDLLFTLFPDYKFPFRKTIEISRRESENGTFGSNVHMIMGYIMGIIILSYNQPLIEMDLVINAVFAVILSTILADLIACLFGKKWGNIKWSKYPSKSYFGTFMGIIATLFFTIPFIGTGLGFLCAGIFIVADLPLSRLNLCDNLTYPILTTFFIRLLWDYVTPILMVF